MIDLEFSFEQTPYERFIQQLPNGETLSASYLLALMEEQTEEDFEAAFFDLENKNIILDVSDLRATAMSEKLALRMRLETQLVQDVFPLSSLKENDPLRLYLEELDSVLPEEDVCSLALQLGERNRAGKNADKHRNALMERSMKFVAEMAKQFVGRGVALLDLIQEGNIGLWCATERYFGTGEDFEAVREYQVRFYMAKAIIMHARTCGIGQKLRSAMEDYRDVDQRLLTELGRNPTLEEIAEAMHTSADEAALLQQMIRTASILQSVSDDAPKPEEEEDQAVEDTAYFQSRQRIMEMLSVLTEPQAQVLRLRFGLEGGLPMSAEEVGQRLALTPDEVVKIEERALRQLRQETN